MIQMVSLPMPGMLKASHTSLLVENCLSSDKMHPILPVRHDGADQCCDFLPPRLSYNYARELAREYQTQLMHKLHASISAERAHTSSRSKWPPHGIVRMKYHRAGSLTCTPASCLAAPLVLQLNSTPAPFFERLLHTAPPHLHFQGADELNFVR